MRRKISESNIFPQFNLYYEYQKIETLISEKEIIGEGRGPWNRYPAYTLENYIDKWYFTGWNLRGTFLSIGEMRKGLGIEKSSFSQNNIHEETILDFLQYVLNLVVYIDTTIASSYVAYIADESYTKVIIENTQKILNQLKARIEFNRISMEAFIVYDDDLALIVEEEQPEIAASLTEYKRIDNCGNLQRKGEILCTLFKKLESVEQKFKGTTYTQLASDTTFLFNKIGARHWVEKDKIASTTFLKMPSDELEKWYDRTFTLFLSCMVISTYLDIARDVDKIKRT